MARAAGTFRWRGTTSGAWDTDSNWIDAAGVAWGNGHYPGWDGLLSVNVDGDTVLLDAAPITALAGFDNTAKGDLAALRVSDLYDKALASAGAYLQFDMQAGMETIIEGTRAGNMYIKGTGAQGIPLLRVLDMQSGYSLFADGAIGSLDALKGAVTLLATAVIGTALRVAYLSDRQNDVSLTIPTGCTVPATVDAFGGAVNSSVAITTLRVYDGVWTQAAGAITTLNLGGGRMLWNAAENITTAYLAGGTLDGSGGLAARTLANCYLYPQATLKIGNGLRNISITNLHILCEQPRIYLDPGEVVTI